MTKVKLYGKARELAGKEELDVHIEQPTTVRDLIEKISEGRSEVSAKAVKAVLINGRNCIFIDGLDSPVHEGDLVEILPFVSGG